MNDEPGPAGLQHRFPEVPSNWSEDPNAELDALHEAVLRHLRFPVAETHAFMAAARDAIHRLPIHCSTPVPADALRHISRFYLLDGQSDRAVEVSVESVRAAVAAGNRYSEAQARAGYATCLRHNGDYFASLSEFERALELMRAEGNVEREAKLLNNLGNWYCDVGLFDEAISMFERIAAYFKASDDPLSEQMALDNAALAALRLGNVRLGIDLATRAAEIWPGEARTSDEILYVVQGALLYCELLIQMDRAEEAAACARTALVVARASGLSLGRTLAVLADVIASYALGKAGPADVERALAFAERESPSAHLTALEAAIRVYEHAGQLDRALILQHELLAINKGRKFEEVRLALGRPSPEEADGTAKLARWGSEVDRKVADLTRIAIDQGLRTASDGIRVFRISRLAKLFALHEGLAVERIQQIELAARLIDVGMIVIPDDLVSKPRDLSLGERRLVERHAELGADLLVNARLALLQPCVPLVRFHHERWDGSGPCALKGEAIPLEARLITLCDAFDALRHDRPWRSAYSVVEALRLISDLAGTQFDPALAARFVAWLEEQYRVRGDFEAQLASEAAENDYVRMRERIGRLVGAGHSAIGPRAE